MLRCAALADHTIGYTEVFATPCSSATCLSGVAVARTARSDAFTSSHTGSSLVRLCASSSVRRYLSTFVYAHNA